MNIKPVILSPLAKLSLSTLGEMIRCARLERRLSQANLAKRLNRSRYSVMAIEKGDPNVAIGVVFEAAMVVGVQLLENDKMSLRKLSNTVSNLAAVLPKKAKQKLAEYNDDF